MDFVRGHLAVEKWGPVGSQLVPLTWTAHSSWTDLGWEHATSNWEGVTVNTSHTVVEIRLCESSLQGVIHETIEDSSRSLPSDINALAGSIPTEIGQCSQLQKLVLYSNQLTGSCDFVIVLIDFKRVDGNALAGSITTEILQCSQLERLDLGCNQLTSSWHFVIVLIDGKRVYQLMQMRWQVRFRRKSGSALS